MTTIVYDHKNKQIACDSRATVNGVIASDDAKKYIEHEGVLYFLCGDLGQNLTFASNFKEMEDAHPALSNHGIFVDKGCAYTCGSDDGNIFRSCDLTFNYAAGSGNEFALSALDFGRTAKQAVEYAMTKDSGTGGKVHVYDIEKGEFL